MRPTRVNVIGKAEKYIKFAKKKMAVMEDIWDRNNPTGIGRKDMVLDDGTLVSLRTDGLTNKITIVSPEAIAKKEKEKWIVKWMQVPVPVFLVAAPGAGYIGYLATSNINFGKPWWWIKSLPENPEETFEFNYALQYDEGLHKKTTLLWENSDLNNEETLWGMDEDDYQGVNFTYYNYVCGKVTSIIDGNPLDTWLGYVDNNYSGTTVTRLRTGVHNTQGAGDVIYTTALSWDYDYQHWFDCYGITEPLVEESDGTQVQVWYATGTKGGRTGKNMESKSNYYHIETKDYASMIVVSNISTYNDSINFLLNPFLWIPNDEKERWLNENPNAKWPAAYPTLEQWLNEPHPYGYDIIFRSESNEKKDLLLLTSVSGFNEILLENNYEGITTPIYPRVFLYNNKPIVIYGYGLTTDDKIHYGCVYGNHYQLDLDKYDIDPFPYETRAYVPDGGIIGGIKKKYPNCYITRAYMGIHRKKELIRIA